MKSEMYSKIDQCTAHKKSRVMVSNFAMRNEENLEELISIAFDISNENHIKAFWVLELVCDKKLKLFVSYIDEFCTILPKLKEDSAIRPASKICMFLSKSNNRKNGIELTKDQEHNLIEQCIDRLIQDEKVAAKVYSMKALYNFGKKYNWIYDELKPIISEDAYKNSAAYQSCARNLLKRIN